MHSKSNVDEFSSWKTKFGAKFTAEEEAYRKEIFLQNLEEVNHHNGLLGTTYKKGMNQFSTLTQNEFVEKHLSNYPSSISVEVVEEDHKVGIDVDWVSFGAVSSVKDEGNCKANYAFSAIGAV